MLTFIDIHPVAKMLNIQPDTLEEMMALPGASVGVRLEYLRPLIRSMPVPLLVDRHFFWLEDELDIWQAELLENHRFGRKAASEEASIGTE
jgi:hypothetical protein